MRGKKAWLGKKLGDAGLAGASLRLGLSGHNRLTILAYHRVLNMGDEDSFAGDPELVSASVADFERQMRFVREHFTPLRFSDVIAAIDEGRPLPRRSLIVTFDDGHHDNYTHAFAVLKATGVPATIFLSTQYVDGQMPFWFDRVAQLLFFAPSGTVRLAAIDHELAVGDIRSRRQATDQMLRRLKQVPNATRLASLAELERQFAHHVPAAVASQRSAVTWSEVREMALAGIEFGSHTVTHPILTRLDDASILDELKTSREVIRSHIDQPVDTVAYPVGKIDAFDRRVCEAAKACGYRLGVSYESGVNPEPGQRRDLYAMRRLAVERYVSFGHFKSMLSLPHVFA